MTQSSIRIGQEIKIYIFFAHASSNYLFSIPFMFFRQITYHYHSQLAYTYTHIFIDILLPFLFIYMTHILSFIIALNEATTKVISNFSLNAFYADIFLYFAAADIFFFFFFLFVLFLLLVI